MKKMDLGKENINKLLLTFSIPCVISMLINSVYNIVDQIFIGKGVGTLGNAATNVIFPLVIIFNAVAGLIGNGAAANLSLKLGEGKKEEGGKTKPFSDAARTRVGDGQQHLAGNRTPAAALTSPGPS